MNIYYWGLRLKWPRVTNKSTDLQICQPITSDFSCLKVVVSANTEWVNSGGAGAVSLLIRAIDTSAEVLVEAVSSPHTSWSFLLICGTDEWDVHKLTDENLWDFRALTGTRIQLFMLCWLLSHMWMAYLIWVTFLPNLHFINLLSLKLSVRINLVRRVQWHTTNHHYQAYSEHGTLKTELKSISN